MTKSSLGRRRNVEDIRRKNLEDNQLFLKQLLMTNVRDDFVRSARSMLGKKETTKAPVEHEKIEYSTRYNLKVKSGEIPPHVPEWQQEIQRKLLEKQEKRQEKLLRQGLRKRPRSSKWTLFYKNNPRPYQRLFKLRHTKLDERIQQEFQDYSTQEEE